MDFELNNLRLVRRMKMFPKLFLGIIILVVIIIGLMTLGKSDFSNYVTKYIIYITAIAIVVAFVISFVVMLIISRRKYFTLKMETDKFTLVGKKDSIEYPKEGLVIIEVDSLKYAPNTYITFIYNEQNKFDVLVSKSVLPKILKYFEQNLLNYKRIN